jgi:acetate kinase
MDSIEERLGHVPLAAVGHRAMHSGAKYSAPLHITREMIDDLRQLTSFDPEHLPKKILLIVQCGPC